MKNDENREPFFDTAESETPSTLGNSMRENRETPGSPSPDGGGGRPEKAARRTSGMYETGESDGLIVPTKRANKAGKPVAEFVEGRGSTKGNAPKTATHRTQGRASVSIGLKGVRKAAQRERNAKFTALLHHITLPQLRRSFYELKRSASPGLDGVTWQEYRRGLEERLADLKDRVHSGRYRAQPSKRAWISKEDGRRRPLGLAALEDKIVQQAVKTVLEQIYEVDFMGFSYGFRPGRSQHNALDALWVGITMRKVNWVLDADIRGFFDAIDHEWLLKFLEHRIADRRMLRLIRKWLRAGISEDGKWSKTTVGTPQGAVISPLLANVFLHYAFDLWAHAWRKKEATGEVIFVRYADDIVMGFQHKHEADRFLQALRQRLEKFGLELHPDKTRLVEFGRYATERRHKRGQGRPETFDFLGFTHVCGRTRRGGYSVNRYSKAPRMRSTLRRIKADLWYRMHRPTIEQGKWLRSVVQGWFNYHAVPGNGPRLRRFRAAVCRLWLHTLRRRSQLGRRLRWARMERLIDRWIPAPLILHPYPDARFAVTHPR